jgi:molybdenum cofactor cytidylyltransferase
MRVAGVVLAAGASSRMGRNKMLIEIEGEALIHRAARTALEAGLDPVVVVVGEDSMRGAVDDLPVRFATGRPGSPNHVSFHAGLAGVEADAAIVILADMPRVDAGMLREIARAEGDVVASRYGDVVAPPLRVARGLFAEVADRSGKRLAERHGATFVNWPPELLHDLDVPEDLEEAV